MLGKLWGNGKGKFRTSGKYSSATVRGTIWLVEDRCEGTLTKVTRGTVQRARLQAQEDRDGEGGAQLPGACPARAQQDQVVWARA